MARSAHAAVAATPSTIVEREAARPRVGSGMRVGRLAMTLGIGIGAIALLGYNFLPTPANESPAGSLAAMATPASRGATSAIAMPEPDVATQQAVALESNAPDAAIERRDGSAVPAQGLSAIRPTMRVHTVVPGDTLWQISKAQLGDPLRYAELAKLSDIRDPDLIHPGDIIRIEIRK